MKSRRNVLIALGLVFIDQLIKAAFFFYEPLKTHLFINHTKSPWLHLTTLIAVAIFYAILVTKKEKGSLASNQLNKEKIPVILHGLTLLAVGAMSNVLDHWWYGGIADYIQIINFYANGADLMVGVGIIYVLKGIIKK